MAMMRIFPKKTQSKGPKGVVPSGVSHSISNPRNISHSTPMIKMNIHHLPQSGPRLSNPSKTNSTTGHRVVQACPFPSVEGRNFLSQKVHSNHKIESSIFGQHSVSSKRSWSNEPFSTTQTFKTLFPPSFTEEAHDQTKDLAPKKDRNPPVRAASLFKKSPTASLTFKTQPQPFSASKKQFSSMPAPEPKKKITLLTLKQKYQKGEKITMCTAYDVSSASFVDAANIDMILVGDSLGMVMLGRNGTESVSMEEMIHHCKAVVTGARSTFIVGDMPFGSYEINPEEAARNAFRLMKESGVHAVKLEGGERMAAQIKAIVSAGIPVIAHVGLTPQSQSALGGFRVQGKTAEGAQEILKDALAVQAAGASAVVIEGVPEPVAAYVTQKLKIPTIGIGAGNHTSGQVLVYHDLLGLYSEFVPKFCKQYLNLRQPIIDALQKYKTEVEEKAFPAKEHTYAIKREELYKAFPDFDQITSQSSTLKSEGASQAEKKIEAIVQQIAKDQTQAPSSASQTEKPQHQGPHIKVDQNRKKIAIIGGGAMGSLISGYLASNPSNDVWMISSWKDHVDSINQNGLLVNTLSSGSRRVKVNARTNVEQVLESLDSHVDLGLILVKSPATQQAAQKASKLVGTAGSIVTLQNGLGNRDTILKEIPDPSRVLSGVISHGSMVQNGQVFHTGAGKTTIAFDPSLANSDRAEEVAKILSQAGIIADVSENLESTIWGKLVVSAGINPLTAILRVKNGFLIENENCNKLFSKTVLEAAKVAEALEIPLPFKNPLERAFQVARQTSQNFSSMYWDVVNHRETEIQSINGAIVKRGLERNCDVGTNKTLIDLIQSS